MFASETSAQVVSIFEPGTVSINDRLSIYRNNIRGSLETVMRENFPLTEQLVGEDFMRGMAQSFIIQNPPTGGCLNHYGGEFATFIENFEPAKALPYLPDIARYEWAKHCAYYAVDDLALNPQDLAAIGPEELASLELKLRDSVHLIESSYPLTAIRDFAQNPEGTLDLDQGGEYLLIHRPALEVVITPISADIFYIIKTLREKGVTLGIAVEKTLETYPDFDIQDFLQTQLSLETFQKLSTN